MNQKLLALYGLKWNPFSPEVPTEALLVSSKIDSFCWRVEHGLLREGVPQRTLLGVIGIDCGAGTTPAVIVMSLLI